jgi:hypothetical protein
MDPEDTDTQNSGLLCKSWLQPVLTNIPRNTVVNSRGPRINKYSRAFPWDMRLPANNFFIKRNDWFNFTNYEDVSESESDTKHLTVGKKKEMIKNAQIKLNNQPV